MQKIKLPNRRILIIMVVVVVAALALTVYLLRGSGKSAGFKTVQVKRGDLQSTISATGTVEPEEVVDIGAQVAGKIVSLAKIKMAGRSTTAPSSRPGRCWPRLTTSSMPRMRLRPRPNCAGQSRSPESPGRSGADAGQALTDGE